jgi:hypothetical protein
VTDLLMINPSLVKERGTSVVLLLKSDSLDCLGLCPSARNILEDSAICSFLKECVFPLISGAMRILLG